MFFLSSQDRAILRELIKAHRGRRREIIPPRRRLAAPSVFPPFFAKIIDARSEGETNWFWHDGDDEPLGYFLDEIDPVTGDVSYPSRTRDAENAYVPTVARMFQHWRRVRGLFVDNWWPLPRDYPVVVYGQTPVVSDGVTFYRIPPVTPIGLMCKITDTDGDWYKGNNTGGSQDWSGGEGNFVMMAALGDYVVPNLTMRFWYLGGGSHQYPFLSVDQYVPIIPWDIGDGSVEWFLAETHVQIRHTGATPGSDFSELFLDQSTGTYGNLWMYDFTE